MSEQQKPGRGRPKGQQYPAHLFTSMTDELAAEVKAVAKEKGMSISELLRTAAIQYLNRRKP